MPCPLNQELDRYDDRMLDNREYGGDDGDARLDAERALDSRDAREGRGRVRGRDIVGMAGASGTEEQSSERFRERRKRQRKIDEQATADQTAEDEVRPVGGSVVRAAGPGLVSAVDLRCLLVSRGRSSR